MKGQGSHPPLAFAGFDYTGKFPGSVVAEAPQTGGPRNGGGKNTPTTIDVEYDYSVLLAGFL